MLLHKLNKLLPFLVTLALFSPAVYSGNFDKDALTKRLEKEMNLAEKRLNELKPSINEALEAKSNELEQEMNRVVEKGFMELDSVKKDLEQASSEAEAKLREVLAGDEIEKLKSFMAKLDEDSIDEIRARITEKLTSTLELSREEYEKFAPQLEAELKERGELLQKYLADNQRDFDKFSEEFKEMAMDNRQKMEELLDPQKMNLLSKQLEEIMQRIKAELFERS